MDRRIEIVTAATENDIREFDTAKNEYFIRDIFSEADLGSPLTDEDREYFLSDEYRSNIDRLCTRGTDPAYRLFFKMDGNRIGFCLYCVYLSEDGKCFIIDFCVDPEYRGQGLGKRCFTALKELAIGQGAAYFELNTHCQRSKRFWESLGFIYNGCDSHGSILMMLPPADCPPECETLRQEDMWQIFNLENGYKAEMGEPFMDEAQQAALTKAAAESAIRIFVLKRKTRVIGMCSVCRIFSTWSCTDAAIFEDFFIEPAFRSKGYERTLTAYVQQWCAHNGIDSLWVGCSETDIPMYRALGFSVSLGNLLAWNML